MAMAFVRKTDNNKGDRFNTDFMADVKNFFNLLQILAFLNIT